MATDQSTHGSPDDTNDYTVQSPSQTLPDMTDSVEKASPASASSNKDPTDSATKRAHAKDPSRPRRKKARRACHACQRAHLTCGMSAGVLLCLTLQPSNLQIRGRTAMSSLYQTRPARSLSRWCPQKGKIPARRSERRSRPARSLHRQPVYPCYRSHTHRSIIFCLLPNSSICQLWPHFLISSHKLTIHC
jgi:hypothetical protein